MKKLLIVLLAAGSIAACKTDNTAKEVAEASVQAVQPTNSDEIVTVPTPVDTENVAAMSFVESKFDFGIVDEGDVVKHTYNFTNTGKQPLVITNARSTCGCTVPVWPKEPVAVGESGTIEVSFNTKGKRNKQQKPVTITANTFPAQTVVYLSGEVTPAAKPEAQPAN